MSVDVTTIGAATGSAVRVLYRCHRCSQGSHQVLVPDDPTPGQFTQLVRAAVLQHHADMSPRCDPDRVQIKILND